MIPVNANWVRLKEDYKRFAAGSFGVCGWPDFKGLQFPLLANIKFFVYGEMWFNGQYRPRPKQFLFAKSGRDYLVPPTSLEPMSYEEAMIEIAKLSL